MTDRPAINEHEVRARQALVTLVSALLARDVSFLEGAVEALSLKSAIGGASDHDLDFDAFVAIVSATDHLPLKAQQGLWNPEFLAKLGPEVEEAEKHAASLAFVACRNLIARFDLRSTDG